MEALKVGLLDESRNESIVLNHKERALQVVTRKGTISAVILRIDEMVQSVKYQKVTVGDIDSRDLQKAVMNELARVTKTCLKYHEKEAVSWLTTSTRTKLIIPQQLEVSWIDKTPPVAVVDISERLASPGENSADIVLRLLRGRQSQGVQGEQQVVAWGFAKGGMYVPHLRENRSMSWRDRLRQWTRYIVPISKPHENGKTDLGLHRKVTPPSPVQTEVEAEAQHLFTATFGHILHEKSSAFAKKPDTIRRVLSPVLPHPAAFTEISESGGGLEKHTFILLNLVPAPGHSESVKAPEVRLRLPVNADDDFSKFSMSNGSSLYAVRPWYQRDILLPSENVDVRLAQQRKLPLDITKQQSIQDFFAASEFNLVQGRLKTPSHTQVSIPIKWLGKKTKKTVNIPYMFAGLEIHQTLDLPFNGHILRYSSIEAGQHGGTRQELSLEALASVDSNGMTNRKQRTGFLKLVEHIARGDFFSWTEGYRKIREIPEGFYDQDVDEVEEGMEGHKRYDDMDAKEDAYREVGGDHKFNDDWSHLSEIVSQELSQQGLQESLNANEMEKETSLDQPVGEIEVVTSSTGETFEISTRGLTGEKIHDGFPYELKALRV